MLPLRHVSAPTVLEIGIANRPSDPVKYASIHMPDITYLKKGLAFHPQLPGPNCLLMALPVPLDQEDVISTLITNDHAPIPYGQHGVLL